MKTQALRKVGFWNDNKNGYPQYPMPEAREKPWKGKRDFVAALTQLQEKGGIKRESYRGWSDCRCCGKMNGNKEYTKDGWLWPEGFLHYVEEHNVKPPQDFIDFIMAAHYSGKLKRLMEVPFYRPKTK